MTAPWGLEVTPDGRVVPRRSPGDYALSGGPGGGSPSPYVPMKRSILDRLASRLFPTLAMMDPEAQQSTGRQGLLQLGTNLLQAGGPQAQQGGTLANIGASIGGVDVKQLAQQALALQAYRQQQAAQRRIGEVAGQNAPKEGESPEQTYERIARMVGQLAGTPGTEDLIGKLSNVLAQIKPQRETRRSIHAGVNPKTGQPELFLIDPDSGESTPLGLGAIIPPSATMPQETERRAGALLTVAEDAFKELGDAQVPSATDYAASKIPMGLGQGAISSRQQVQNQAATQLARAYLYVVSGANATQQEAEAVARTYLPQLGDDPATVSRKKEAREAAVRAIRQAAGRAATPAPKATVAPGESWHDYLPSQP